MPLPISLSIAKLNPLQYMTLSFYPCSIVATMKSYKQSRTECSSGAVHEARIGQNTRAAEVFISHERERRIGKRIEIHLSGIR
jgi:hypothetical protein